MPKKYMPSKDVFHQQESIMQRFIRQTLNNYLSYFKQTKHREKISAAISPVVKLSVNKNNEIILSKIKVLRKIGFTQESVGFNKCLEQVVKIVEDTNIPK